MMQSIGDYEYGQSDLIGHGAFALVFKGREKIVSIYIYIYNYCVCVIILYFKCFLFTTLPIIYYLAHPILCCMLDCIVYFCLITNLYQLYICVVCVYVVYHLSYSIQTKHPVAVKQILLKNIPGKLSNIRQKEIAILKVSVYMPIRVVYS